MRRVRVLSAVTSVLAAIWLAMTPGGAWSAETVDPAETLFQFATLDALLAGGYDGSLSLGELKKHGDLGLGTFDALDGEMIVLAGEVYQAKADGTVARPADSVTTPFAAVTSFHPDMQIHLTGIKDFHDLAARLEAELPSANHVFAIRCTVYGATIRVRSVEAQNPPYRPLVDVVKEQQEFQWTAAQGNLVGFWCPQWLAKLNAPGLHLHYLSDDRSRGGHLLHIETGDLLVEVDTTPALTLLLPQDKAFTEAELDQDRSGQTRAVEHQTAGQ